MEENIILSELIGQTTIFFNIHLYQIDLQTLKKYATGQRISGTITGYNIDRIVDGEISLFYNPVIISKEKHKVGVDTIIEYIESCR